MTRRRLFFLPFALILAYFAAGGARAADAAVQAEGAKAAPKAAKKKAAKRKAYDYGRSKYKAREPSRTPAYRFNAKGEPILGTAKKKPAAKKKMRSEPPETEAKTGPGACGLEDGCAERKTEADAL